MSYGSINNNNSIGIEMEGNADWDAITTWQTSSLNSSLQNLVSWLCSTYGIPKDRAHIVGHNQVPSPPSGSAGGCTACRGPSYWGGCCAGKTDPGAWFNWTKLMEGIGRSPSYQSVASTSACSVLVTPEAGAPTTTSLAAGQKFVAYDTINGYRAIFLSGDEPDNPYATKAKEGFREYHWDGFVSSSCVTSTNGSQLEIANDSSGYWNVRTSYSATTTVLAHTTNGKRYVANGSPQTAGGYTWYPFDLAWDGATKTGWTAGAVAPSACTMTVTTPNGGETWTTGQQQSIGWTSNGGACGGNVKIELLKGGSVNTTIVSSTSNDGSFSFTPSASLTTASDYTVRITDTANSSYTDTSNSNFTITAPSTCTLTVTAPNGGETWSTGQQQAISWTSNGAACGGSVRIELLKSGSLNSTISSSTSNDGSYSWAPSASLAAASDYAIRVTDTSNASYSDISNSTFAITAPSSTCSVSVSAPNGGETWIAGQTQAVTWTSSGATCGSNVKLELLKNGSLHTTIIASTPNDGNFSWTLPNTLPQGSDYTVRITDTSNSSYVDTSNSTFTITGSSSTGASYDAALRSPKCATVAAVCDSGTLLTGRGSVGPELNAPNTIANSCQDGNSGAYQSDESVERIVVTGQDGSLTVGHAAKFEVTIWAYGAGDHLDLYYAPNAASPVWSYLGSADIQQGGEQTWNLTYVLPDGNLQAFRAHLRWQGDVSSCSAGSYDDHYDLVFAVQSAGVTVTPTSGLITTEAGGVAQFTVRLNAAPTANVTIPVSSNNTNEGLVSPAVLTFTSANWNTLQTVTVTGVDDAVHDGNVGYSIVLGAASSADPIYNLFNPSDVSVTNNDNDVLGSPALTATFSGATNVDVIWSSISGANSYELQRSHNAENFALLYAGGTPAYVDPSCPAGTTCVYRVRAIDALGSSVWTTEIATTLNFTDATLTSGQTSIKALHITQARAAVNAVRRSAGQAPYAFTDSVLTNSIVKAIHLSELRSALDAARGALGLPSLSYAYSVARSAPIRAIDLTEIRNGTR